ncbi:VRR-NUC domain-containing protein [Megasphaera sp.]|uniref:VRR-NUC domain-containing protein n=1 Tax=Megasphaera sp. TaxID=2023260 RepID=UPI0020482D56|nr:MAG TPA: Nuclease [Caudoviricetes sp.]
MKFLSEKQIEQKLVTEARQCGGMALKFVSPSYSGMPDRLILLPDGKMAFVEVKAPGKKPRPLQVKRHEMLRKLGFQVFVLDDVEDITGMLKKIMKGDSAG